MLAVSVLSQGTMIQKLSLAFQLYDENNDGVLCYDEIMNIVKVKENDSIMKAAMTYCVTFGLINIFKVGLKSFLS